MIKAIILYVTPTLAESFVEFLKQRKEKGKWPTLVNKASKEKEDNTDELMTSYSEYNALALNDDAHVIEAKKEKNTRDNSTISHGQGVTILQYEHADRFTREFDKDTVTDEVLVKKHYYVNDTVKTTDKKDFTKINTIDWDVINSEYAYYKWNNSIKGGTRMTQNTMVKRINKLLGTDKCISSFRKYWSGEFTRDMCDY